jgi:GNAT superfamily N-acetyltransferase
MEAPGVAPLLRRWFEEEWAPWYGADGPGDAAQDLAACRSRDALPICLVALGGDGDLLGTAALKHESVGSELAPGPWLAALLVHRGHRNRGVASALVGAIEAEAARLGFTEIFTSTDSAAGIVERRGWRALGTSDSLRGSVTVYRCRLRVPAAP